MDPGERREHHFAGPAQPRPITISVGVAERSGHVASAEELVAAADAALYEAKRTGRNRVVPAVSQDASERAFPRLRRADDMGG